MKRLFRLMIAAIAVGVWSANASPPPVRIVYFVPTDREIIPGYVDRLDRIMTDVQRFYRAGMTAAGYGPLTFALDRDDRGHLRVPVVRGQRPMRSYGRNSYAAVRSEVKSALVGSGLEMDHETVVIFQVLLSWRGNQAEEVGPYVGAGDHRTGTAWVYDDERLDPRELDSRKPGGFYGRPCSIGEFNSHYIGGVAHELGHAFGLPHVAGPAAEKRHSLMGDGNHTYGEDLRGEGAGSYLHPASALRLSHHCRFAGPLSDAVQPFEASLAELDALFADGKLVLQGRLRAQPAAGGVIAYNDNTAIASDYDAVGWTAPVDQSGGFRLEVGQLEPGQFQLRLESCHVDGRVRSFPFDYCVAANRVPDFQVFRTSIQQTRAMDLFRQHDRQALTSLTAQMARGSKSSDELMLKMNHLLNLLNARPPVVLANVPAIQKRVPVADLEFASASTGWGPSLRNQVVMENQSACFIQVGGQFYESGLYAHAPANHTFKLHGGWKGFSTGYGLQDGHDGSVVFVVRGDGRELFRSTPVKDHRRREIALNIAAVNTLELAVEDAGDGPSSDWGLWLTPVLER